MATVFNPAVTVYQATAPHRYYSTVNANSCGTLRPGDRIMGGQIKPLNLALGLRSGALVPLTAVQVADYKLPAPRWVYTNEPPPVSEAEQARLDFRAWLRGE